MQYLKNYDVHAIKNFKNLLKSQIKYIMLTQSPYIIDKNPKTIKMNQKNG